MKKYIAALCLLGLFAGMAGGCGGQGAGTPQTPQLAGELNLEQAGEHPQVKEAGLTITVLEVEEQRIARLLLVKDAQEEPTGKEESERK